MNKRKLFQQILNNQKSVRFNDFIVIIEAHGFYLARSNGSHFLYKNKEIAKTINIQSNNGEAKPYQIEQFLSIVEKYDLRMED